MIVTVQFSTLIIIFLLAIIVGMVIGIRLTRPAAR
jgi:hypothetical protein